MRPGRFRSCQRAVSRQNFRAGNSHGTLHRVRERWVSGRTAVINQIRGLLLERGITIRKGRRHIEESLPGILENADNKLSGSLRVLLTELRQEMQYLRGRSKSVTS
jgi:transposase